MQTRLLLPICGVLAMVSCETMNRPLASGDFDPLQTPGSGLSTMDASNADRIRPGQMVVAAIDNTAFYNQRPGENADADKLLSRGTSMKVISTSGSLFRVELDSGEVGFVPSVMVENPNVMADDNQAPFDLYPPGFDLEPIPPLPEDIPPLEPLPDVIEPSPEAPPEPTPPAPADTPPAPPDTTPAPVEEDN